MQREKSWDLFVRVFHWSVVLGFALNLAVLDDEGAWHERVGYAVLALALLRILWGFAGPAQARFSAFPPSLSAALAHLGDMARGIVRPHRSHNPLGALMVYNLLACMLALGATGWMMTTDMFWGVDWVEELHEFLANWAIFSVVLHVGGVIAESLIEKRNLVRPMVTGYKDATEKTKD
ncbi:cytochrome B [Maritimibacter sp. 55A14]|uniref:cytochrome b/b6 domain-containing protein n=1 Tax=Maritimibacter sp. 55A14 TaxID=2174844 RepID=UPI000D6128BA|nr:cytochrome b/b6 domain-containing protein [Maritimibacter sp. 55A14]PWE34303.1 cytochrome B [Maritimibacter sp. 55A14]